MLGQINIWSKNPIRLLALGVLFTAPLCIFGSAYAAQLTTRSLSLASVKASAVTNHTISFAFPTNNSVGSLKFEYCTNPLSGVACSAPAGVDTSTAILSSQSGETGFSILSQTTNTVILTRLAVVTGNQQNSYILSNVKNPSGLGSFYVRISSYASNDATGALLDFGGTVGVITQAVLITSEVPQILNFCVGVNMPGSCSTASGNFLNLGTLSATKTATGTSHFLVGTNANFGYIVRVNGHTLTSGNNTINNNTAPSSSQVGQAQFGINLRANTVPAVGANPNGGTGTPTAAYNQPNAFTYNSGDIIASDAFVSDEENYTVSYIANITPSQPVGYYNTTLTYVCTATF